MTVTETTTTSWTSRLGDSLKGILGGLALIILSIGLLFWNEGRTLHRYEDLQGTAGACIPVKSDSIDSANEGKPVYLTGEMKTEEVLSDPIFTAVTVNAIKLKRKVEMFQWKEVQHSTTQKELGGSEETKTTYTYDRVWSESPISSGNFHDAGHDNPSMDFESGEFTAQNVTLGAFDASELIELKNDEKQFIVKPAEKSPVKSTEEVAPAVEKTVNKPTESTATAGTEEPVSESSVSESSVSNETEEKTQEAALATDANQAEVKTEVKAEVKTEEVAPVTETEQVQVKVGEKDPNLPEGFKYFNNGYYRGKNTGEAEIGDLRVSFTYVPNGKVSVIAGQQGNQLINWQSKYGRVKLLQCGVVSKDAMIATAQSANKTTGWLLRAAGVFLMFIGFSMVFKPLSVLADVVPFIGNLVEGATGIISFILALSLSCLTIGVAWLYYRPLIGIPLVLLSIILFGFVFVSGKKKKA